MRGGTIAGLAFAVFMATAQMMAQQGEGPILRPKKAASATLLLTCDLACNWKLDGETMGHIAAGGGAKAKVQLGQHVVVAVTENGLDQTQQIIKVEEKGQTVVAIELRAIREARQKSDQEAQEKAAREQRERETTAHEQAVRDERERDRQAKERAAQEGFDRLVWIDPATGLMWTRHDNGFQLIGGKDAYDYCSTLRLAGFADWGLPSFDELTSINNPGGKREGEGVVKGGIQLSGNWIIGYKLGKVRHGVQHISPMCLKFEDGDRYDGIPDELWGLNQRRVLCVRRASH